MMILLKEVEAVEAKFQKELEGYQGQIDELAAWTFAGVNNQEQEEQESWCLLWRRRKT